MKKIAFILMHNRFLYAIYYYIMTFLIHILKLFVRSDPKLILFVSYSGAYFNDSPRAVYEKMLEDPRFRDYKLVWAFQNPKKFPSVSNRIKIDSFTYFKTALKARCWVTNVAVERGLGFSGKHTYYFHTTHTTLPKLCGKDAEKTAAFTTLGGYRYDCSCAQSEIEAELQLSMYGLKPEQVLICGYPKNDYLVNAPATERERIRSVLGIPKEKKVVLYAPTFREVPALTGEHVHFETWKNILGDSYVVLFRAHPVVRDSMKVKPDGKFVIDVSDYPENAELMLASDILISDYSGIFYEFGVLGRPMYCYAYDYDDYTKNRQLYFDLRTELPGGFLDEEALIARVRAGLDKEEQTLLDTFRTRYVRYFGHATEASVNNIFEHLENSNTNIKKTTEQEEKQVVLSGQKN